MIVWLDHRIFGNGRGLRSPYWDDRFYWLNGELYHWIGGLGAQLSSFQWTHPKASERRKLAGYEFKAFNSSRRWGRVSVSWALVDLPRDLDGAHAMIREVRDTINSILMERPPRMGVSN